MKKVKCRFTYEANMWVTDREYEMMKERAGAGQIERELKRDLDDMLLDGRRSELSKITSFYFGEDKEWK